MSEKPVVISHLGPPYFFWLGADSPNTVTVSQGEGEGFLAVIMKNMRRLSTQTTNGTVAADQG